MHTLSVMIKPASGNCNMHCDYCFYCDEMENRVCKSYGFMSEATLKNVIRKTMTQVDSQVFYAYQGGEPTLRGLDFFKKAVSLQDQYNHNHIAVSNALQTNGYALDEEWCRFFKENHFLIGVSVDGIKQIHDRFRHSKDTGGDTYARVLRNIDLLDKFGVDYNILTVVTGDAARSISQIYHTYQNNGWHHQQYIDCLDPLQAAGAAAAYSLDAKSLGIYMTKLFDLWYADLQSGKQPYIRKFENYVAILAGRRPESCEQRGECGIQIVVEADGSAYPCDFYMLDAYRLGNFNENRLPEMDRARTEIGFIDRSRRISQTCRVCEYYPICLGGCQRSREFLVSEQAYRSRFCEGYRYFFDHCIDRLQEIADSLSVRRG